MIKQLAILTCFIAVHLAHVNCQFEGAPKAAPRKEDVKLIKCQVCHHLADNAYQQVEDLKASAPPGKKVDELAVIDLMEDVASTFKDQGDWMTALHLEAAGGKLAVVDKGEPGECKEACKTIERAAQEVMGEHDTDIAEALFMGRRKAKDFRAWLCTDLTAACSKKPAALPKGHTPYPAFVPRGSQQNIDKMLHEMEAQGMKGKMWSRDDLMNKYMDDDGEGFGEMSDMLKGGEFGGMGGGESPPFPDAADGAASPEDIKAAGDKAKAMYEEFQRKQEL